jgi:hypothetical protein
MNEEKDVQKIVEEAKTCVKCDNMFYMPGDNYTPLNLFCGVKKAVDINQVTGEILYNDPRCHFCRKAHCNGDWYVERSPDKPNPEQIQADYLKEIHRRGFKMMFLCAILLAVIGFAWTIVQHLCGKF